MAENRLIFLFSPFAFSSLWKACSYFKGVEAALVNRDPCTVPGTPGLSHFCCRALNILHFLGNLSEETEGLILQTANTPIVLNKTFHGLIKISVNSRQMVDFINWITPLSVRELEGLPVPWTMSQGWPHTGSASPSRMQSHSTWAEHGSRVYWLSQTRQSSETHPASPQKIQSGAKGDRGRDRSGDKVTTWVQNLSRRDCQRHGGMDAARWNHPGVRLCTITSDVGLGHGDRAGVTPQWRLRLKKDRATDPGALCRECGLGARQGWRGLSVSWRMGQQVPVLARVQSEECRSRTPAACKNVNHKHTCLKLSKNALLGGTVVVTISCSSSDFRWSIRCFTLQKFSFLVLNEGP